MSNDNIEDIEIRKVQALTGERSFVIVLAKQFASTEKLIFLIYGNNR